MFLFYWDYQLEYQYSFNKELAEEYSPKFKTVMAAQPEIEEYANFVKDKFKEYLILRLPAVFGHSTNDR